MKTEDRGPRTAMAENGGQRTEDGHGRGRRTEDGRLRAVGRSDGRTVGRSGGWTVGRIGAALAMAVMVALTAWGKDAAEMTAAGSFGANVLRPNDVVIVKVYQEEDLETKAAIDKDGFLSLPLLGPVKVAQKTPDEAITLIRDLYGKDYLVNPQVSLSVFEKAKLRFTVMGQVQKPGSYEFPDNEPVNLLQGIAIAGGYTRLGAPSKVTLQRMQNGKPVVLQFDAERMSKDKKAKPFELLPEDIITVGERVF